MSRLTAALGYRYAYDEEHDQYVHPGAAYVLRADGRVSQVLTGLGLSPGDMRLALVEAGEGRVGTIGDQVRLLCSGLRSRARQLQSAGVARAGRHRPRDHPGARRRHRPADPSGPPPRGLTSAATAVPAIRHARHQLAPTASSAAGRSSSSMRLPTWSGGRISTAASSKRSARVAAASHSSAARAGAHLLRQQRKERQHELRDVQSPQRVGPAALQPRQIPDHLVRNVAGPDDDVLHRMQIRPQQQHARAARRCRTRWPSGASA